MVEAIGTLPCVIIDRTIDGLIPSEHGWDFVVQADRVGAMQATLRLAGTEARRVGLISFRITSYNVCYTKLLRGYEDVVDYLVDLLGSILQVIHDVG